MNQTHTRINELKTKLKPVLLVATGPLSLYEMCQITGASVSEFKFAFSIGPLDDAYKVVLKALLTDSYIGYEAKASSCETFAKYIRYMGSGDSQKRYQETIRLAELEGKSHSISIEALDARVEVFGTTIMNVMRCEKSKRMEGFIAFLAQMALLQDPDFYKYLFKKKGEAFGFDWEALQQYLSQIAADTENYERHDLFRTHKDAKP